MHWMGFWILALNTLPVSAGGLSSHEIDRITGLVSQFESANSGVRGLVRDSLRKAGVKNLSELLSKVSSCQGGPSEQLAAVKHRRVGRTAYIPRDLGDLVKTRGEPPPEQLVEEVYLPSAQKAFQTTGTTPRLTWSSEADLLAFEERSDQEEICLRAGISAETAAISLTHELVHYTRRDENFSNRNISRFKNIEDYAFSTIQESGDEVDAYILQFGLQAQLQGKSSLPGPKIAAFFDAFGNFIAKRGELASFILNEMGYTRMRMHDEYLSLLRGALQNETRRQRVYLDLVNIRTKQERAYFEQSRKLASLPPEKENLESAKALHRAAGESRTRILKAVSESDMRRSLIQKRLAEVSVSGS